MRGADMAKTPILMALIGGGGMLAKAVHESVSDHYRVHVFSRPEIDITNADLVYRVLGELRPQIIVNCAAYTNVDGCESAADTAFAVNGDGPRNLASVARDIGATLVHVSTDYVFSGKGDTPYRESDATGSRSVYGSSKLAGEEGIVASGLEKYFIVRTSWLYGAGGKNFVETMVRLGKEREELRVVSDQIGSPTLTCDLADAIFNLLSLERRGGNVPYGTYHFSNKGLCSWHGFAEAILAEARASGEPIVTKRVIPIGTEAYPLPAPRPGYSVLSKEKYCRETGAEVPHWQESLAVYFEKERN
jgi:dTDP-4-dehydrorhamnose reductase